MFSEVRASATTICWYAFNVYCYRTFFSPWILFATMQFSLWGYKNRLDRLTYCSLFDYRAQWGESLCYLKYESSFFGKETLRMLSGMCAWCLLRLFCLSLQIVRRKGRVYVICKKNPRHKQRQGYHTVAESHEHILPPFDKQPCNCYAPILVI